MNVHRRRDSYSSLTLTEGNGLNGVEIYVFKPRDYFEFKIVETN